MKHGGCSAPGAALVLILALLLIACGDKPLDPLHPDATILAFGDSLTAGVGTTPEHSYPSVLAELSGRRVINAGVSGETTAGGLARLPDVLDDTRPELIILLLGGNDILRNVNPVDTRGNLAGMIELARSREIPVVLIAVPERNLFSSAAPFYRELADEYGLVLEDRLIARLLRNNRYKSDPIHFNQLGYRTMAEGIHQWLVEHGAL